VRGGRTSSGQSADWSAFWTVAAGRYGTPLYLYELPTVHARVDALRRALPRSVRVSYAIKANGSLALAAELRRLGCGADVCSLGELETVRAAGFSARDVLYTGPAKSDREIDEAVSWGVGLIVLESAAEAARVARAAGRAGVRQPVLLRVNPGSALERSGMAVTAPACKFGVDEADMVAAARRIRALPGVELRGIHVSTESNVRSADRLLERAEYACALVAPLAADGFDVEVVDLGGGLGVPQRAGDAALDVRAYGAGLRRLTARHPRLSLILELGRYPVAESGSYLVSVVAVKRSRGATFVLVDGGINHLYRPRLAPPDRPPPVLSPSRAPVERVTIGGPLLDADDLLAQDVLLPRPRAGDLLAIPACGAYGYNHGLQGFCLHATPAEVAWDGRRLHLVRERGDPVRVTEGQHLPAEGLVEPGEREAVAARR
jgi:diaminopimelate decarboxylase